MRRVRAAEAAAILITLTMPIASAHATTSGGSSTGTIAGHNGQDGTASGTSQGNGSDIGTAIDAIFGGTPGTPGTGGTAAVPDGPPSYWISFHDAVFVTDPPCYRSVGMTIDGGTQAGADAREAWEEDQFVSWFESYISIYGVVPPPCPGTSTIPVIDPTPAQTYADDWATTLPSPSPTISGGYAITGLRSWLDTGHGAVFTDSKDVRLGAVTLTVTLTATSTATVAWGDGTATSYTGRGGTYHEGEPGPGDITHTFIDTNPANTLGVQETWHIVIEIPGLADIVFDHTTPAVSMTFPVEEMRTSRDR